MSEEKKESKYNNIIEVKRIDGRILQFTGKELNTEDTQWITGKEQTRWDTYTLYELESEKYILFHKHDTRWMGEGCYDDYTIFYNTNELVDYANEQGSEVIFRLLSNGGITIIDKIE